MKRTLVTGITGALVLNASLAAAPDDWLLAPAPAPAEVRPAAGVDKGSDEIALDNGLVRRTFRVAPNAATVGLDDLMSGAALLRGVKPEAVIEIDGERFEIGGLTGQGNYAYLDPRRLDALTADPGAFGLVGFDVSDTTARFPWKRVRHYAPSTPWPPPGVHLRMDYRPPAAAANRLGAIEVAVHYELYDGIPVFAKWITVRNGTDRAITLDRFTSEILAVVEQPAHLQYDGPGGERPGPPSSLHVETDYAFVAGNGGQCLHCVHWVADPEFSTQVDYQRRTPCLLEVRPELGPAARIAPGGMFESFRTFVLVHDSTERERRGLARRRMYRALAPWATENPLMMHVRYADPKTVRSAIDQCAEVGFEMVILTFGSGFNIEDDSPEYFARMRDYADYARERGVEIGGYSLLASRRIGDGHDVVMPEGRRPTFGNAPCLHGEWGHAYFDKLRRFYEETGFMLLEHDGSYPGDVCAATHHPGHRGLDDSRWAQWTMIADFYRWCRGRGVYLNVPDWYFLTGAGKTAMGYRETNWSLPRAEQVIHTRQNIYDGTWEKTPSMGWMFVPLVQYHGGGAAATIEPLREHLDHYRQMLQGNLALGVQACYRGPRLYDGEETAALVKKWVGWYKTYRDILESDVIHGRRADGRDLDWMLHVNPRLERKGMLVVFNPLERAVTKTLEVDLYYTGLKDTARVRHRDGEAREMTLSRDYTVELEVTVPAGEMEWWVIE